MSVAAKHASVTEFSLMSSQLIAKQTNMSSALSMAASALSTELDDPQHVRLLVSVC